MSQSQRSSPWLQQQSSQIPNYGVFGGGDGPNSSPFGFTSSRGLPNRNIWHHPKPYLIPKPSAHVGESRNMYGSLGEGPLRQAIDAQSSSAIHSDWKEFTTANRKRYYYNKKLGKTTWEKPIELMTLIERADLLTNWKEFTSTNGDKYYHNKVTKQSTWKIPQELKFAREKAVALSPLTSEDSTVSYVDKPYSPTILFPEQTIERNNIPSWGHGVAVRDLNVQENSTSAFESISNMMEVLELHEEKAKQSKEEASKAGENIIMKVEELRKMLKREKEANDMHAGRVTAEKFVLATESCGLLSRLRSLSDEINRSPSVIREIHDSLKARIAFAKEELEAAKKEKLDKEARAQKLLSEHQLLMEHMVDQSRILKQQQEENATRKEFLIKGHRIVDELQQEVAVIQENVQSLDEMIRDK